MKPFSRKTCTALVAAAALGAVPAMAALVSPTDAPLPQQPLILTQDGAYINHDGEIVSVRVNNENRAVTRKDAKPANTDAEAMRGARAVQFDAIARLSVGEAVPGYFVNPTGSSVEVVSQNHAKWSGNGQYVVFPSAAANFVPGDTNARQDIFRLDVTTDEIIRLTTTYGLTGVADGSQGFTGNAASRAGAYSANINNDGTKVAFWSSLVLTDQHNDYVWPAAGSLAAANAALNSMLYWRQLDSNGDVVAQKLVSDPANIRAQNSLFLGADMDSTGDKVVFTSVNNYLPGSPIISDVSGLTAMQVYVWDGNANAGAGQIYLVTKNSVGDALQTQIVPNGGGLGISDDGTKVVWHARGNTGVTGRSNSPIYDTFVADVTDLNNVGRVLRASIPDTIVPAVAQNTPAANDMGDLNWYSSMSPNGEMVAYVGNAIEGRTAFTGSAIPPTLAGGYGLYHVYIKNVFGASAGDLIAPVRNENYAQWVGGNYSGSVDGSTRVNFSGDGQHLAFGADWDVRVNQTNPPFTAPVLYFPNIGTGVWTIDTATWSVIEQRFQEDSATSPINDGNRAPYALSLGPSKDIAAFVVGDGETFPGDSALAADLALYDDTQAVGSKMSRAGAAPLVAPDTNDLSGRPAMSDDGNLVAYVTFAENVVNDDTNGVSEVVLFDRATSTNILLSRDPANPGVQANNASGGAVSVGSDDFELELTGTGGGAVTIWHSVSTVDISADGRYVVFPSGATNLGAVGVNRLAAEVDAVIGGTQIYVYDTVASTITVASDTGVGAGYDVANDLCWNPVVSDDGRYVAFQTFADNLVGTGGGGWNIVRRDMTLEPDDANAYVLVSDLGGGVMSGTENVWPQISADGSLVCWMSLDDILIDDQANGVDEYDIYLWTEGAGISLVSGTDGGVRHTVNDGGNLTAYDSIRPVMSNNGDFIAFRTLASFDPNDPDGQGPASDEYSDPVYNLYVHNVSTGTTRVVFPGTDENGFYWNSFRSWAKPSNDGRIIVFHSLGNYSPADDNDHYDLYAYDRFTDSMSLLSRDALGQVSDTDVVPFADTGAVQFDIPFLNSAGDKVAFAFQASNLVPDDGNGHRDVFLVDLSLTSTGVTEVESSWDLYQ